MKLKVSYFVMAIVLAMRCSWERGARPRRLQRNARFSLEQSIKRPVCRGQSVAESDSEASKAIRTEVERRIAAGQSDNEIRAYFAETLGDDILLRPPSSGWAGLVWVIPIAGLVVATAGIGYAFWRWRTWSTS